MKKNFVILLVCCLVSWLVATSVFAATPTISPSTKPTQAAATTGLDQQQITDLQERIASRVAQLKLVEKKGIIGTVTDVTETQITLSDMSGNKRFVDVDELTNFSSISSKSNFGISDITRGTVISVLGLYNKESQRILARFISVITLPDMISGAVTAVDGDNFTITVTTLDQKDLLVEIQDITKTYVYTKADGLVKSGFSKIMQGERVVVVATPDTKDTTKLLASRIVRFPELPANPKIAQFKPGELNIVTTPATGSAKGTSNSSSLRGTK